MKCIVQCIKKMYLLLFFNPTYFDFVILLAFIHYVLCSVFNFATDVFKENPGLYCTFLYYVPLKTHLCIPFYLGIFITSLFCVFHMSEYSHALEIFSVPLAFSTFLNKTFLFPFFRKLRLHLFIC